MPRVKAETSLAPQEVGGEKAVVEDKKIEAGADLEISKNAADRANQLFDRLQADLKRRKQEAKQAGKDPKEVKGFDKSSQLCQDWLLAFNENQMDLLEKKANKLQVEIDRYEGQRERIPDKVLADFQATIRKIASVSAAKRVGQDLSASVNKAVARVEGLHQQAETLGKPEDLNIVKEVATLQGVADVARAQLQAVDDIAIGANDNVEGPPPVPEDYVEEIPASELEEIVAQSTGEEVAHPNEPIEAAFFAAGEERVEASAPATGAEMINMYFADFIAKDQKAGVGFREAIFNKRINDFVGEDVVFAKLLLKDSNFIKSVQNFFDAPVGPFSNKALEKAAQFSFIIQEAKITYDRIREELKNNPNLFAPTEVAVTPEDVTEFAQEDEGVIISTAEVAVSSSFESKATQDYFNKLYPEGFTHPKQIEAQVKNLQSDMEVTKKSWQIQQDTLARTKFYEVFKRNSLKAEIANSEIQIRALSEALIDLGEKLTAQETVRQLLPDSELARLNKVLGDHLKSLQKELAKNDTRNILDRYGDLAVVAFAFLTVALNVAEAGRAKNLEKINKPGIESVVVKPKAVKENPRKTSATVVSSYRPVESVAPVVETVVFKPEATTPVLESVSKPEESRANKFTRKEKRGVRAESKVEKKQPVTVAELEGKIGVVTGEIADLQNRLDQVPPVLDIASLTTEQLRKMDQDPNGAKQLNKKLEAKKAELAGLEKDKLALVTAELAQAGQPTALSAGDKLDFSQIKPEFTINDLGKDEEAGMRATGAYARDLLAAHDRVKKNQALAGATSDETTLRQYLQDANDAQKLYEYILGNKDADKAPNQYTLDQAQAGLSIAKKQIVALEKSLPTKDAKVARADALEALNKIVDANKNRIAVRKGARGVDERALHGSGGAVEILQGLLGTDLNKGAQLKQLERATTQINIVLKDASAHSALRADARVLAGIVKDLKSSLTLPATPDISFQSAPGKVSGAMRQDMDQKVQEVMAARAGANLPPKED